MVFYVKNVVIRLMIVLFAKQEEIFMLILHVLNAPMGILKKQEIVLLALPVVELVNNWVYVILANIQEIPQGKPLIVIVLVDISGILLLKELLLEMMFVNNVLVYVQNVKERPIIVLDAQLLIKQHLGVLSV